MQDSDERWLTPHFRSFQQYFFPFPRLCQCLACSRHSMKAECPFQSLPWANPTLCSLGYTGHTVNIVRILQLRNTFDLLHLLWLVAERAGNYMLRDSLRLLRVELTRLNMLLQYMCRGLARLSFFSF